MRALLLGLATATLLTASLAQFTVRPPDRGKRWDGPGDPTEEFAQTEWEWGITLDQAREIASKEAGVELDRAPAYREYRQVGFATPPGHEPGRRYWVNVEGGWFYGWEGWPGTGFCKPFVPLNRAMDIARDEARRHLGDLVDTMDWRAAFGSPIVVEGRVRSDRDPPVYPTTNCTVKVDPLDGHVGYYVQHPAPERMPGEPKVSLDEALEALRNQVGAKTIELVTGDTRPSGLWHTDWCMEWHLWFQTDIGFGAGAVNALTGEVAVGPIHPGTMPPSVYNPFEVDTGWVGPGTKTRLPPLLAKLG